MKAVVQRVLEGAVEVENTVVGQIGPGLLVDLGVDEGDSNDDLLWLAEKIVNLRIFPDHSEKMTFPITAVAGWILVVSQFTLCANLSKGNRPSFSAAADPEYANMMYQAFINYIKEKSIPVSSGVFGAMMMVSSVNDGPVTILLDSKAKVS